MGFTKALVSELDTVGDWGLLTTDGEFVVTGWNRWLERHSGRPAAAVVGRPLFDAFPDLSARKLDRYYRQAMEGRIAVLSQQFHKYVIPLPPPSRERRFDLMQQTARVVPLVDGRGVSGTVTVIEDVTERVAYEAELRERVEALREADRRKDEFLATLAHELRNPLAPIRNALQIMHLAPGGPMVDRARALIDRQVTNMVRLVDDLLEVSRITRGKVELRRARVDLRVVLDGAIETSRPLIESSGHRLGVTAPDGPVHVDGDATRLGQIVSNLLNNAAKYTPPGGRVDVALGRDGGHAVVSVADTGIGIAPEMLPKVFDLFTQVDASPERSQGGLGIGLALVRKLLALHGGTVEARSEGLGRGSVFTVRLPVLAEEPIPAPSAPAPAAAPAPVGRRVLVVDDNVDAAVSLATLLELSGHSVHAAHDGRAAVAAVQSFRPDVVFMDLGMPGLSGYDACREIRVADPDRRVVVVALTGWGQEADRRRTAAVGFDAHLTKPITADVLAHVFAELPPRAASR